MEHYPGSRNKLLSFFSGVPDWSILDKSCSEQCAEPVANSITRLWSTEYIDPGRNKGKIPLANPLKYDIAYDIKYDILCTYR